MPNPANILDLLKDQSQTSLTSEELKDLSMLAQMLNLAPNTGLTGYEDIADLYTILA